MYWFRTGTGPGPLLLVLILALWMAGGYLLATAGFRLQQRERLVAGLALGLLVSTWIANLIGRWLPPATAFWLACLLVPVAGVIAAWANRARPIGWPNGSAWRMLGLCLLIALFVLLIGRGVGILDDRKNLSFISIIAAGEIPPPFYMNAEMSPSYHYGFQLFAAMLMRLAGMLPWSAFDLAKGLAAGLAIGLSALMGWRLTHRAVGAAVVGALVAFASGGRWMLLLVPQGLLRSISAEVTLWGSAATSAPSLFDGLAAGWVVEGGPPFSIPLAFLNGIWQPFVLGSQAGPGALSIAILMLVILLIPRARGMLGYTLLVALLAAWALVFEADFVLFTLGIGLMALLNAAWKPRPVWRGRLRRMVAATLLAGVITLAQGGTLSDVAGGVLRGGGDASAASPGFAGFSWRWPPAIVSSHLGELELLRPPQLLAGLFELGPPLLVVPIGLWAGRRFGRRGRFELAAWGLAALVGLVLPLVLSYRAERDITRLTAFGLLGSVMLAVPLASVLLRARPSGRLKWASAGWLGAACLGGLMVAGSLMTAIPRATLSTDIAPIDARMADRFLGELQPGSLVLDSHAWRAVVLTGRPTISAPDSASTLPEWEAIVAAPRLEAVIDAGFRYVYVDEYWWQQMGAEAGPFAGDPCAELLGVDFDSEANGSRRLYDLGGC